MDDKEFLEKLTKWTDEGTSLFIEHASTEKFDAVERIMLEAFEQVLEELTDEERLIMQLTFLSGKIANMAEHLKMG